jgi:hypothetical protein
MLTWKLWRGLKKPAPRHPLFQRIMSAPPQDMPWYITCGIILVAPFLLLPAIVFLSAVYGLRWAMTIAGTIAREREVGMYELISLTPAGLLGSSRAIMAACMHRNESLAQIQSVGAWVMRMAFGLVLMLSTEMLSTPIIRYDVDPLLGQVITPIYLLMLGAAVYIDHVQSIVVSELVGMLMPIYTRRRTDAALSAGAVYLLVQTACYTLTLLLGFVVLSPVMEVLPILPQLRTILLPFLRVAIFYSIREGIIRVLWRRLVHETNAAVSEMDFMTG